MDDYTDDNYNNGLVDSSTCIISNKQLKGQHTHQLGSKLATYTKRQDQRTLQTSRATATNVIKSIGDTRILPINQAANIISTEPYCHVKLDSIIKLKDSTKKLLCLLENIQSKSHTKYESPIYERPRITRIPRSYNASRPITSTGEINSATNVCKSVLKRLETQTKVLETFAIPDEDDCSIFKRLTRKCNCLNQLEYNDFVIHFNEETKYFTSTAGEIIKNLRILKKFLYMGGEYSKHALMFLNEGLEESSFTEKEEIIEGCAHVDMCNVFEDVSIVTMCITWAFKHGSYGDTVTQELAATFLFKIAQLEKGRRYLKYTSTLTDDIRKILKRKEPMQLNLNINTVKALQATLVAMQYYDMTEKHNKHSISGAEGFGSQTIKALIYYRRNMTMAEIMIHLHLLNKLSSEVKGQTELTMSLKPLAALFKEMLLEYDDSEMNIIVTDILNNIMSKNFLLRKQEEFYLPQVTMLADTSTEPIAMKDQNIQTPAPKQRTNRSKKYLKVTQYKIPSRRIDKTNKNHVIIVPIEKKKYYGKKI